MEIIAITEEHFLFLNFNCNLSMKYTTAFTLSNKHVGPYFVVKYFSFTCTIHLA
jgi:hypothetical protein